VYYPLADIVFVGASLVDHGGHNIMEPMALGKPVLMGQSTFGIAFVADKAAQVGAFESLPNVSKLEARISLLLRDPQALKEKSLAASLFAQEQTGAADRTLHGMLELIPALNERQKQ
jgi:3-deoxy-D-manno-octulosonic-acid transferase